MNEELTERQKYIAKIENELSKAARSKAFVGSDEGQYVINYIGELISQKTNELLSKRRTHEEYIEIRAQIDILRKLKQVLEVQSNEEVIAQLSAQLDLARAEE